LHPPAALGTEQTPPPDDQRARTFDKFFGVRGLRSDDPRVLRGNAGSPGKVKGTARVLRSASEGERLRRGDVIVAATTAPSWTPLFAAAAAVVTETGGILSHAAVVAREFAIPAVVGVAGAADAIKDGQMLEVDGDTGAVRILGSD
jgi:pyruvate,water dikinase